MGDAADDYFDSSFDDYLYGDGPDYRGGNRRGKNFQSGTGNYRWKQSDGTVIDMWDMDIAHLENSIRICEERGNTAKGIQLQHVLSTKLNKDNIEDDGYQDFLARIGATE